MVRYARQQGVTEIKVEQICERSQHNEGGDEQDGEGDGDDDDDDDQYGETDGGGRYLVWAFSTHKTESTVPFDGNSTHTVSPTFTLLDHLTTFLSGWRVEDQYYQYVEIQD